MSTFADRLLELIDGESRNAFARRVGIGEASLRQYLAGTTPGLDKVVQIARITNVSVEWLATGDGPRNQPPLRGVGGTQREPGSPGVLQVVDPSALVEGALVLLPRLDVKASAGRGVVPQGETVMGFVAFQESYLRSIGINPRFAHMLQITGDSMAPTLVDQDWVVVDTSIDRVVDEAIYAVVYGDAVLAKRVQMLRGGGLILSSDNKAAGYVDEHIKPVDLASLHIVGRIKSRTHTL